MPVVCAIFAVLLAVYVGGYFGLSKSVVQVTDPEFPHEYIRIYELDSTGLPAHGLHRVCGHSEKVLDG